MSRIAGTFAVAALAALLIGAGTAQGQAQPADATLQPARRINDVLPGTPIRLHLTDAGSVHGRLVAVAPDTVHLYLTRDGFTMGVPRDIVHRIDTGRPRPPLKAALRWGVPLALVGAALGAADCQRDIGACRDGYGLAPGTGNTGTVVRAALVMTIAVGGSGAVIAGLRPGMEWRPLDYGRP